MFLYKLKDQEKKAFLRLAKRMVHVDDKQVDGNELMMLAAMAKEMEIELYTFDLKPFQLEEVTDQFKKAESKNICIIELAGVALANGSFHPNQQTFVKEVAEVFGLNSAKTDQVVEAVQLLAEFSITTK